MTKTTPRIVKEHIDGAARLFDLRPELVHASVITQVDDDRQHVFPKPHPIPQRAAVVALIHSRTATLRGPTRLACCRFRGTPGLDVWTAPGPLDTADLSFEHRRLVMGSQRFAPEFKEEAVRQVVERDYSVPDVAARLGVSAHSLYKWVKMASPDRSEQQSKELLEAKSVNRSGFPGGRFV